MRIRTVAVGACLILLGGCDLVRMLLPRKAATAAEARAAIERCGVVPDDIAWRVDADGTFAFGRKSADAPPMTEPQTKCLLKWVDDNRIKVAFIAWETAPR
jgi:hypothetical protein